jgi:hypothetical protein
MAGATDAPINAWARAEVTTEFCSAFDHSACIGAVAVNGGVH